jgi:hypothetical protein
MFLSDLKYFISEAKQLKAKKNRSLMVMISHTLDELHLSPLPTTSVLLLHNTHQQELQKRRAVLSIAAAAAPAAAAELTNYLLLN